MNHTRLKRGVLHSFMWAIAHQLNNQFPNRPARKLKGIALTVFNGYTATEQDILNHLKNRAWERIEDRFDGQVNMPFFADAPVLVISRPIRGESTRMDRRDG